MHARGFGLEPNVSCVTTTRCSNAELPVLIYFNHYGFFFLRGAW